MVVKVYISGISGNKEVKKRQQRVLMILDSKSIQYEVIDITEPGKEDDKEFMQTNSKSLGGTVSDPEPRHALPPQIFNDDEFCGDYDQFDLANELDTLEQFLKVEAPPQPEAEKVKENEKTVNGIAELEGKHEDDGEKKETEDNTSSQEGSQENDKNKKEPIENGNARSEEGSSEKEINAGKEINAEKEINTKDGISEKETIAEDQFGTIVEKSLKEGSADKEEQKTTTPNEDVMDDTTIKADNDSSQKEQSVEKETKESHAENETEESSIEKEIKESIPEKECSPKKEITSETIEPSESKEDETTPEAMTNETEKTNMEQLEQAESAVTEAQKNVQLTANIIESERSATTD